MRVARTKKTKKNKQNELISCDKLGIIETAMLELRPHALHLNLPMAAAAREVSTAGLALGARRLEALYGRGSSAPAGSFRPQRMISLKIDDGGWVGGGGVSTRPRPLRTLSTASSSSSQTEKRDQLEEIPNLPFWLFFFR